MTLEEFVEAFAGELDNTPAELVKPDTEFKSLEDWGSLAALSIIAMIDENLDKQVTGADLRSVKTIEELYNLAISK